MADEIYVVAAILVTLSFNFGDVSSGHNFYYMMAIFY